jgi:hypothetical protein
MAGAPSRTCVPAAAIKRGLQQVFHSARHKPVCCRGTFISKPTIRKGNSRETSIKQFDKPGGRAERRSFLKNVVAGGATLGARQSSLPAFSQNENRGSLTNGDIAILRFLAAVEIIEFDLWLQYAELGGTQDSGLPGLTGGSAAYTATSRPSPIRRHYTFVSSSKAAAASTQRWRKKSPIWRCCGS